MKKKLIIITIIILFLLWLSYYFTDDISRIFEIHIKNKIENKKIEKLLDEYEPEIVCENWFSKFRINKTYQNNSIIVCSNKEWIRSWNFIKYNKNWIITQRWQYYNDKKNWKRIEYNYKDWKEIWYEEYKDWLRNGIYKTSYGSWIYKSWYKEWLWIEGFYENWQIQSEVFYKSWQKIWTLTWYYSNGSIWKIENYRNWYYHWDVTTFYENWQIESKWIFKYWNQDWKRTYYKENWEIDHENYFYEWILINQITDQTYNNSTNQNYNNFTNQLEELSEIIQNCFWKDVIEDSKYRADNGSHDFFEYFCDQTLSWLESQKDDNFWLKQILIEITKSWIDYSKIRTKSDACWEDLWVIFDTCNNVIDDEEREIMNKIRELYIEFSNILKNIKNENQEIDIDKYFYIPNKIISWNDSIYILFYIDEEKSKTVLNDMLLQEVISKKNEKDNKMNSNKKSNDQINYEKLVNLVDICMWEDILHSRVFSRHVTLSYDNYLSLCNYTLWELENFNLTWNFSQLKNILISLNNDWIDFANIWKEEDLLLLKESNNESWLDLQWDENFNKLEKNLEDFKINYKKLEKIIKNIQDKYNFKPEINFYIPYSVINENLFRLVLEL